MAVKNKRVLIIGAGTAGLSAAKAAMQLGAKVVIAGSEPHLPYYRPRLIDVLLGHVSIDSLLIQKQAWYEQQEIEVMLSKTATQLDIHNKEVFFSDGKKAYYDKLIIACGAIPNRPSLPYMGKVFTLRSFEDAIEIASAAKEKGRAYIVGGGSLGIETAFSLRKLGIAVSIADRGHYLLGRQLDKSGGEFLARRLAEIGITVHIDADYAKPQEEMEGAAVIAACGVSPEISLAKEQGIATSRGMIVDSGMETSQADIFACGDVAEYMQSVPGLMPVALAQGKIAGQNAAGEQGIYTKQVLAPSLKVADIPVMSIGNMTMDEDAKAFRLENDERYSAIIISQDKIKGAALIGDISLGTKIKTAIEQNREFSTVQSFDHLVSMLSYGKTT